MEKREENKKPSNEIILNINTYDDIFSDFDPRVFSQRSLSDDFLIEVKKVTLEKEEPLKLRFLMPFSERNLKVEGAIKKRLNEHFQKHAKGKKKERNGAVRQGLFLIIIGILLMFFATIILTLNQKTLLHNFLIILLEPAGWFSFWEGLYIIVFKIKEKSPDLEFYEKMSKASIIFDDY